MMIFEKRKEANSKIVQKINSDLPAGSAMFYYCHACDAEMKLPETHPGPAPQYCWPCEKEGRAK